MKQNLFDPKERNSEKQASRDEDARRLRDGEVTPGELQAENNWFKGFDLTTFEIVAIGGRPIKPRR